MNPRLSLAHFHISHMPQPETPVQWWDKVNYSFAIRETTRVLRQPFVPESFHASSSLAGEIPPTARYLVQSVPSFP